MSNQSTVQPVNPLPGTRRRRARAVTRSAGVLVAAGAMVAAAFATAAPAGASAASSPGADLQAVAAVSPVTGWAPTGSMITPRARHAAARLADGRVLVAGGSLDFGFGNLIASSELYNPATGTWEAAADMPIAVADAAAVTLADDRPSVWGRALPSNRWWSLSRITDACGMTTIRGAGMFAAVDEPSDGDPREHGPTLGDERITMAAD